MKATCGGCDSTWAGETRRAHCSACHRTFSNAKLFDRHRKGLNFARANRCYSPEEMALTFIDGTWYDVQNDEDAQEEDFGHSHEGVGYGVSLPLV